jgi:signal transduction histidine kinase
MRKTIAIVRSWLVPAILVVLAALLTLPWTFWVVVGAYERDVNEKVEMLAQRVRRHLATGVFWVPQNFQFAPNLKPLETELLADKTVQVVSFVDSRNNHVAITRDASLPVPRTLAEVEALMRANEPTSYRKAFQWEAGGATGVIYIDLSKTELWNHFWLEDGPFLRRVAYQTAVAILVVSIAGIVAYRLWGSAARQRLRAELEQQGLLAERGLAAAVLAHEIRNPLAALRFQLHSLRKNATDQQRVAATADTIDGELQRIQQLVQDYLAHEKAQSMRVAPVELADAVKALQTLMGELLKQTGTRLTVWHAPQRVVVMCDPHALRQVLMNLVLNAQQAMGYGGSITIRVDEADGYGTISVADTGPGIPDELKDRLFKPFITSRKEGSGIGLALVKRFVDNFGGSVSVQSEKGRGTTFELRLPLALPLEQPHQRQPLLVHALDYGNGAKS